MKRFLLSRFLAETLETTGLWLIIVGLIGEAALVFAWLPEAWEKPLSFLFTLVIAFGVWVENVGAGDISSEKDARIAEANARAAEAELAMAKLEERLAPRRITQKDQEFIASEIAEFTDQLCEIGCSPPGLESKRLENAIHDALMMGRWKISRGVPSDMPPHPGGVVVSSTENSQGCAAADKLAAALNKVGVYAVSKPTLPRETREWLSMQPQLDRRIFVTVGAKPDAADIPPPPS